jgi:hypothetical protein
LPTEIVNLDQILPDDIDFVFDAKKYRLSTKHIRFEQALELGRLMGQLSEAEAAVSKLKATKADWDKVEELTNRVAEILLSLFRVRHPDMEVLPFGAQAFSHVLAHVLIAINYAAALEEGAVAANPPNRAARRAKKKSPQSSSSRSS